MPTWLLALVGEIPQITSLLSSAATIWNSSTGNTLQKIEAEASSLLNASQFSTLIAGAEKEFPALSGGLAAASALLSAAQSNMGAISWLQTVLNAVQADGIVSFNGQGTLAAGSTTVGTNSPLTVDGQYGILTKTALQAFQTRFGLPATGVFTDVENTLLTALSGSGSLPAALQAAFATLVADIQKII